MHHDIVDKLQPSEAPFILAVLAVHAAKSNCGTCIDRLDLRTLSRSQGSLYTFAAFPKQTGSVAPCRFSSHGSFHSQLLAQINRTELKLQSFATAAPIKQRLYLFKGGHGNTESVYTETETAYPLFIEKCANLQSVQCGLQKTRPAKQTQLHREDSRVVFQNRSKIRLYTEYLIRLKMGRLVFCSRKRCTFDVWSRSETWNALDDSCFRCPMLQTLVRVSQAAFDFNSLRWFRRNVRERPSLGLIKYMPDCPLWRPPRADQ
ncbi:Hypothetical_protein [Hexamita inflata]|uniref:Hypothetical_protein n=1 Tax=Hexamita inflata TaxID=28002 RepID=A0AA86QYP3_9EUKA|nr:Hypothetical protein HINF_LOCUS51311 [Hexamita inflata]